MLYEVITPLNGDLEHLAGDFLAELVTGRPPALHSTLPVDELGQGIHPFTRNNFV